FSFSVSCVVSPSPVIQITRNGNFVRSIWNTESVVNLLKNSLKSSSVVFELVKESVFLSDDVESVGFVPHEKSNKNVSMKMFLVMSVVSNYRQRLCISSHGSILFLRSSVLDSSILVLLKQSMSLLIFNMLSLFQSIIPILFVCWTNLALLFLRSVGLSVGQNQMC